MDSFSNIMCHQIDQFKALQDLEVLRNHLIEGRVIIKNLKQNSDVKDTKLKNMTFAVACLTDLVENLSTQNPFALIENFSSEEESDGEKLKAILGLVKQAVEVWQNTQKSIQLDFANVQHIIQNPGETNFTFEGALYHLGSEDISDWKAFQKKICQPSMESEEHLQYSCTDFSNSSVPSSPSHELLTNSQPLGVPEVEDSSDDAIYDICYEHLESWRNRMSSVDLITESEEVSEAHNFVFSSPPNEVLTDGNSQPASFPNVEDTCDTSYELGNDDIAAWRAFQEKNYFSNGNSFAYVEQQPESALDPSQPLFKTDARSDAAATSFPSKRRKTEEDRMDVANVLLSLALGGGIPADPALPEHDFDNTTYGFKCICGLTCEDEAGLYAHIRQKEGTTFHCKRCDGKFERLADLRRHIDNVHLSPPSGSSHQNKLCRGHGMQTKKVGTGRLTDSTAEMEVQFTPTPIAHRGQERWRGARRIRLEDETPLSSRATFSGRAAVKTGLSRFLFPRTQS